MKKLMMGLLVVLLLVVVMPVTAQGNGEVAGQVTLVPENFLNIELYEMLVTVLGVLVIALLAGFGAMTWITTGKIHQSLTPELLRELLPFMNLGGSLVGRTETEVDDRAWMAIAEKMGYAVIRDEEDGTYTVVPPEEPEAQSRKLSTRRAMPFSEPGKHG